MQTIPKIINIGQNEKTIGVGVKLSKKAKRVIIKVDTVKNGVELVVPENTNMKTAHKFLLEKETWIRKKLGNQEKYIAFTKGASVPIQGALHEIVKESGRGKTKIRDGKIIVHCADELIPHEVSQLLYNLAAEKITRYAPKYAKKLKVSYKRISVKDTKSLWGSCSRTGNLSFSWRLIMAPKIVLEYVVAHEISHLREMNHSPKFWHLVEKIFPAWRFARTWLRNNGKKLHSFGT